MKSLQNFSQEISLVFTDIDDTLTDSGKLGQEAYEALWALNNAGIKVIPVTGRPAGWCEMIARQWPVRGVIGENGALFFAHENNTMFRYYDPSAEKYLDRAQDFDRIFALIKSRFPQVDQSSDQFCRLFDFAVDFREDVPTQSLQSAAEIQKIFEQNGATAKVSSIHVNGWFGSFDKLSMAQKILSMKFGVTSPEDFKKVAFIGDSPNDEPMWAFFANSFGVANMRAYLNQLKTPPNFVTQSSGGKGFSEFATRLIELIS